MNKLQKLQNNLSIKLMACLIAIFCSLNASADERVIEPEQKTPQDLVAEKLSATFAKTTFTNLEPSPIDNLWQAEISNQVVYFFPDQEFIFFGEIYDKNGISISEQTRQKWQSKRTNKLDISSALVLGNGPIEIIEFTDTDCPFCRRFGAWADKKNAQYRVSNGQDLFTRKVIMTPIDALHPNAWKEAVHVLCVADTDSSQSNQLASQALLDVLSGAISYADMLNCKAGEDRLRRHRSISESFGVSATPTLIINSQVVQGFNEARLDQLIREQLNKTN